MTTIPNQVISNTTVISNFAAVGELALLRRLFGELFISVEVHREILSGLEDGYSFYSAIHGQIQPIDPDGWIHLTSLTDGREIELFSEMPRRLHTGEASSLAIAQNRGFLFLSDDKAARKVAVSRQIPISGTVGCLVFGVERQLWTVSQANDWLREMVADGFYSPVADLQDLIGA